MYRPKPYRNDDREDALAFVRLYPFAAVVSCGAERPLVTHVPLLVDSSQEDLCLLGHFAKANDHWRSLQGQAPVVAIFSGPNSYVSASFYRANDDVPTWNYQAVHARGTVELVRDGKPLRQLLERTVAHFEARNGTGWTTSDIMPQRLDGFMRQVVGFRIWVANLEAAAKLSQDKDEADQRNVAMQLMLSGGSSEHAVAAAMQKSLRHPPER
jgi:transcriptional regulator